MENSLDSQFYAIVVVYNKSVQQSATINALVGFNIKNLSVLVFDNSTVNLNNRDECRQLGIEYLSQGKNLGLSKAYNIVLNYLTSSIRKNDIIIWFDDDTHVTKEYFSALYEAEINYDIDVFVPIIKGQDGKIYSPNNARFLKNKLLKTDVNPKIKKFNAINSCLAVRFRLYAHYRYDECLFLDSVDQNFFEDLRLLIINYAVLPVIILQNFSQREKKLDSDLMRARLEIRVKDLMIYARKKWYYSLLGLVKSIGWGLVFCWKCKSPQILFTCFKYSCLGFGYNFKRLFKVRNDNKSGF